MQQGAGIDNSTSVISTFYLFLHTKCSKYIALRDPEVPVDLPHLLMFNSKKITIS
jgi:hypothetical protein